MLRSILVFLLCSVAHASSGQVYTGRSDIGGDYLLRMVGDSVVFEYSYQSGGYSEFKGTISKCDDGLYDLCLHETFSLSTYQSPHDRVNAYQNSPYYHISDSLELEGDLPVTLNYPDGFSESTDRDKQPTATDTFVYCKNDIEGHVFFTDIEPLTVRKHYADGHYTDYFLDSNNRAAMSISIIPIRSKHLRLPSDTIVADSDHDSPITRKRIMLKREPYNGISTHCYEQEIVIAAKIDADQVIFLEDFFHLGVIKMRKTERL